MAERSTGGPCSIEGGGGVSVARSWCNMHYRRWLNSGDPGEPEPRCNSARGCQVEGCDEPHCGLGYCETHRKLFRYHGSATPTVRGRTRYMRVKAREATCVVCGETKPADSFRMSHSAASGLKDRCIECDMLAYRWRRNYGLSIETVFAAYREQDGCCAVCGDHYPLGGRPQGLVVDHSHVTGEFRALLCSNCNVFIGLAQEDPDRLVRAVEYLRRK